VKITAAEAQDLWDAPTGTQSGRWIKVDRSYIEDSRWTKRFWLVVTPSRGNIWPAYGLEVREPLTELQIEPYPWDGVAPDTELPLTKLVGSQVVVQRWTVETGDHL
jgi:hypothetical protein